MISILYVDDQPVFLDIVKVYLEKTGMFKVDTKGSAKEALQELETQRYDLIVSDYQMPEMDGIGFLKAVRERYPRLPFIILTGHGREEVAIDALNNGADCYIQKGTDTKALFAELQNMIRRAVEREHMEEALLASEERYRNVVQTQTEFITRFLPDGTHIFANDAYCQYFGKELHEMIGHRLAPNIPKEDLPGIRAHFSSLTRENPVATIEHRIIMPNGEIRWQVWNDRAIFDERGELVEYQSVGRDVTKRKKAEEALREKEKLYRDFFMTSRDSVFITSPEGKWIDFNDAIVELFGYDSREEFSKIPVTSVYADEEARRAFHAVIQREGYVKEYPVKGRKKDGTVIDCLITTVPIRNPDCSIQSFVGTIRDVTGQKRAEEALRESEENYHVLVENAPIGILTCNNQGQIIYLNPRSVEMLGSPGMEETQGVNLLNFPLLIKVGFAEALRKSLETGLPQPPLEAEYTSKWGKTANFRVHISPLFGKGSVQGAQIILDDITHER